jgi:transmembrane sensor
MAEPEGADERWEQIARYLAGESSPAEAAELEAWLDEEPGRRELVVRLGDVTASLAYTPPADLDVEGALARVHERMDEPVVRDLDSARAAPARRPPWRSRSLQIAAAIVLLLAANVLVQRLQRRGPAAPAVAARTFQTPIGQADTIQLADGSTVILAPGSRLEVGDGYGAAARNVALEGVAWFRVRHQQERPFTVRAGAALVTDLGTAFTVRADLAQPVLVAVTEGSVRLAANDAAAGGVILEAGQRGAVEGGEVRVLPGESGEAATAWTAGRLVFEDAPFGQVAAELHRWFGVTLVAGDHTVAGRHLTSKFEGESLNDVLAVLALALDARTEVRGDTIVLRSQQ